MKNINSVFRCVLIALAAAAVFACGHSDSFKVKGSVADGSSINLRYVYYIDGAVKTGLTASTDGKFEFEGNSPELTAVEVYDNEYRLLGRFVAANGDDIVLRIDRNNPYKGTASGNDLNKTLTRFYNDNAEALNARDSRQRNMLIARFAAENPDSPVAALLVASEVDASTESGAALVDSILGLLTPKANVLAVVEPFSKLSEQVVNKTSAMPIESITYKARGNRIATFVAQRQKLAVIAVSDATHGRDSVLKALRAIAKHSRPGHLAILDLSIDADTMVWVRNIRNDSASWEQGWAAGSISGQSLERIGIPAIPYFILLDSAGNQMWRGRSATQIPSLTVEKLTD